MVINCQHRIGLQNKCNGPVVEPFLDAQTKSRTAETDGAGRRVVSLFTEALEIRS